MCKFVKLAPALISSVHSPKTEKIKRRNQWDSKTGHRHQFQPISNCVFDFQLFWVFLCLKWKSEKSLQTNFDRQKRQFLITKNDSKNFLFSEFVCSDMFWWLHFNNKRCHQVSVGLEKRLWHELWISSQKNGDCSI